MSEKPESSMSMTLYGWSVEARCVNGEAYKIGSILLGSAWKRVVFLESKTEVPRGNCFESKYLEHNDFYSYESAQALRWRFIAEVDSLGSCWHVETRLVKHEVKLSIESRCIGVGMVEKCAHTDDSLILDSYLPSAAKGGDDAE